MLRTRMCAAWQTCGFRRSAGAHARLSAAPRGRQAKKTQVPLACPQPCGSFSPRFRARRYRFTPLHSHVIRYMGCAASGCDSAGARTESPTAPPAHGQRGSPGTARSRPSSTSTASACRSQPREGAGAGLAPKAAGPPRSPSKQLPPGWRGAGAGRGVAAGTYLY